VPRQPSKAELAERIEFVRALVSRRCLTSVIKAEFRSQFGDATHETILRYVSRARVQILADAARGRDEMRAESLAFYNGMLADPGASHRDRIRAQERIDKLLGLERPQQLEVLTREAVEVDEHVVTTRPEAPEGR